MVVTIQSLEWTRAPHRFHEGLLIFIAVWDPDGDPSPSFEEIPANSHVGF